MRKLVLVAGAVAAVLVVLVKKQRERELNEAIWEEPTGPSTA